MSRLANKMQNIEIEGEKDVANKEKITVASSGSSQNNSDGMQLRDREPRGLIGP